MVQRWFRCLPVLLVLGCGEAEPPRFETSGAVTFEGKPVPEAQLLFSNAEKGIHLTTKVENGLYNLQTHKGDGLPEGTYKVAVLPPPGPPLVTGEPPPPQKEYPNIPAKYRNAETSGFTAEVKTGVANAFAFDMHMQGEKVEKPVKAPSSP